MRHTEHAGPDGTHYVQMWVRPAAPGGEPAYDTVEVGPGLAALSPLRQPAATLHAGWRCRPAGRPPCHRRRTGTSSSGPARSVAEQPLDTGAVWLGPGDAARLTGGGPGCELRSPAGAEVIAWEMRAGLSVG